MEESIKYRREVDWPRVLKNLEEFKNEFSPEFRDACRKRYLLDEIETTRKEFLKECQILSNKKVDDDDELFWTGKYIEKLEKKLSRLDLEVKILVGKVDAINREKIEKARQYPIEKLIEVKGRIARCPFHNEKTPSMDVKNNFYYCYGCGAKGDVISLFMKINNVDFKKSVEYLSTSYF